MLAAVSISAQASDWEPLIGNSNGEILIDVASITREGPRVKIWLKQVYPNGLADNNFGTVGSRQARWIIDCSKKAIAQGDIYVRDMKDGIVFQTHGMPNDFSDIVPDTTGEAVEKMLCKH
ncbi:hypothetical protein BZM27_12730 [Paraburkholderia steynii]|uniref:Surface-adhesin protein E-like domain-containing protein n=1 Tax=Paraburkholderia steynii TaxID=1245441 RepID=A0A4R0XPC5_9BURK|nr:hypothetical protein BZM27_12730 [Paraburkholderia steynii]